MAITQKDIAEKAQVSRSLVARVLNGDATIQVSHGKRQLILRTAHDLGYRPNLVARNLRRGKTHAVVAICQSDKNETAGPFMQGVLEALAIELAHEGYELKVRFFEDTSHTIAAIGEMASASECDAFALWLSENCGEEAGSTVQKRGMPFVISGHYDEQHPDWHQVDYDHALMMHAAVQHLSDAGRTRIAYLGFDTDEKFASRLLAGYKAAVEEIVGTAASEDWVYRVSLDYHETEEIVNRWLDLPLCDQPTGIVVGAGTDAWVGIEVALAARGRRIGPDADDVSVVGQHPGRQPLLYGEAVAFDSIDLGRLASLAARDLLRQLHGESHEECIIRVMPSLVTLPTLRLPSLVPRLL